MQLNITGRHIEVTAALHDYVQEKFSRISRHFDQVLNIEVILEVQKLEHKAEATLHVSGNHIFADATSDDMYAAIDALTDKLDRQLLKHKEKIKDHRNREGAHRNLVTE
ncbi:MAG: ribosome-associated translation inhibitor RaiA [Aquificaceae bacterium]|nr:MAG: ribosome-associated translation inhibitor RaiA [Aquificaceae bacterium]